MSTPRSATRLLPLALLAAMPAAASAQSAAEVMERAREAFTERAEGIENYTVTQRTMGQETTMHMVRDEVDGIVIFRPVDADGSSADPEGIDPAFFFRPNVAARMTYEGHESVDGQGCHDVSLDDFQGLGLEEMMPSPEEFSIESMRFCVDDDEHIVRRMVMTGTTAAMGEPRRITTTILLKDYRDAGGMLHPWRTEMTTSGMEDVMQGNQGAMSDAMKQMEEQLAQLPEAQREQVRKMMESRMGAMEEAAGAVAGKPIVVEVLDVKVNQGPPAGGER